MSEETSLVVRETGQLVTRFSAMDALAEMTEQEFTERLNKMLAAQRRMEKIQHDMMEKDTDYGVIPGTGKKPTILKPGAEKLCAFHRLVPTFDETVTLGDGVARPHIRVSIKCYLHYLNQEGPIVGEGVGAANSWEKKYRWRDGQRKCPSCGEATIYRSKYPDKETGSKGWYCFAKKGGCGANFNEDDPDIVDQPLGQIENPDPFDLENTLKKMAEKRGFTDATLRATLTSGLFTQDVEDDAPPDTNGKVQPQQADQQTTQTTQRQPAQNGQRTATQPPAQRQATAGKDPEREVLMKEWGGLWQRATMDMQFTPTVTVSLFSASKEEIKEAIGKLRAEIEAVEEINAGAEIARETKKGQLI
jgi:hypothetical protein